MRKGASHLPKPTRPGFKCQIKLVGISSFNSCSRDHLRGNWYEANRTSETIHCFQIKFIFFNDAVCLSTKKSIERRYALGFSEVCTTHDENQSLGSDRDRQVTAGVHRTSGDHIHDRLVRGCDCDFIPSRCDILRLLDICRGCCRIVIFVARPPLPPPPRVSFSPPPLCRC